MPTTPNMSMVLPTEGGDDNVWDTLLNAALTLNDAHDHTTGKGVKVPSAGLNINADISFGGLWATTAMRAVDFTPVAPADVASLAGAFFVNSSDSNNLYFRTVSGSNVKVTDGTTLNVAGFAGGIGGDYSTAGALVAYVSANKNYTFKGPDPGGGRRWEGLAGGQVDIYEQYTTAANRVRLQSPAALAASYELTLPAAPPASTALVAVSSAGVMTLKSTFTRTAIYNAGLCQPLNGSGTQFSAGQLQLLTDITYNTCAIDLEVGEVLTAWSVKLSKTSASGTITAELVDQSSSGSQTQIGSSQTNSANNPGAISLGATGLSTTAATGHSYFIRVAGGGTTGDLLLSWEATSTFTMTPI